MLTFILFFGAIITLFVVVSTTITKSHISTFSSRSTVAISHSATLPQIPRNLAQIHSMMDPKQFELFSAAVIIAL